MRRIKVLTNAARVADIPYEDFYDNLVSDWQDKAHRLQVRRWRQLKQQLL